MSHQHHRCLRIVMVGLAGLCAGAAIAQSGSQNPHIYPNPYKAIENPLTLPAGRQMGWVMGLDIDRNGKDIWVLDTCGGDLQACATSQVAPIMRFDASGKSITSFGEGLFVHPHGVYVDAQGNVWIADGYGGNVPDIPNKGHQVFKFTPEGRLLLTLGTAGIKGNGPNTFNTPSDVLVAPNGDIFVADGHGGDMNDRIVKFTKDGTFLTAWGTKGKGAGQFDNTHSLAMDSRGRLFVADRSNLRIQIFDQKGNFLDDWRQFGAPSEIIIDRSDVLYAADSVSNEKTNPGVKRGIRIGSSKDGRVTAFIPDELEPNINQELIAVDASGNLWAGFTTGRMVRKYVKK